MPDYLAVEARVECLKKLSGFEGLNMFSINYDALEERVSYSTL